MTTQSNSLTPASDPNALNKYILQAFDATSLAVAQNPGDILNLLIDPLDQEVPEGLIFNQGAQQAFESVYIENTSYEETSSLFAAQVGISGSCGFFSGSVQVSHDSAVYQSTNFFGCYSSTDIDRGSKSLKDKNSDNILNLLKPGLVTQLKAIDSLAAARDFTHNYGTHLITRIKLGGNCIINIQSQANTYADKEFLAITINNAYSSISSAAALASASTQSESLKQQYNLTQSIIAKGGDAGLAAKVDSNQSDAFGQWADSCTSDTILRIEETIEYWALLPESENASKVLKQYIDLVVLNQSLSKPAIFFAEQPVIPEGKTYAHVTVSEKYKIISGGARLSIPCTSFLQSSYPSINGSGEIDGWNAFSNDLLVPAAPGDLLAAYAIAVCDPGNLLQVEVNSTLSPNTGSGIAIAYAPVPDQFVLTGGGAFISYGVESAPKFLNSIHPWHQDQPVGDKIFNTWVAQACDYQNPSTNTSLRSFGIGISCKDLNIEQEVSQSAQVNGLVGNTAAELKKGLGIAGGGVYMVYTTLEGEGNFLQQSFPSNSTTWQEHNECYSPTEVLVEAFAIGLKTSIRY
jgi:hypothetical protein